MAESERVLMVDDEVLAYRAVRRVLGGMVTLVPAISCSDASSAMEHGPWDALIVDVSLPDGSGLEWLSRQRRQGQFVPALVLSAHCQPDLINKAFELRASYLCKPFVPQSLRGFVSSLSRRRRKKPSEPHGRDDISGLVSLYGLTPGEIDIVHAALAGMSREEFASMNGITMNTYKTRVRRILRKAAVASIGELRDRVLRQLHGVTHPYNH